MGRWGLRHLGASVLTLLLLAGCGGSAATNTTPSATPTSGQAQAPPAETTKAPENLALRLDFLAAGYDAPFAAALKNGYYKQAGVDLRVGEGKGSSNTVELVGSGSDTFGLADFGTAAQAIAKGVPVQAVMVFGQKSPLCIFTRAAAGIDKPTDLEGKTVAVVPGGADAQMVHAFLTATHVSDSKVRIIDVDASQKLGAFTGQKADAILGWTTVQLPAVAALGIPVRTMCLADVGLNTLNLAVFASDSFIRGHPDAVRAFVSGSVKGWQYAQEHPDESLADLVAEFPGVKPAIAKAQLEAQLQLLHTPATQGKVIGWVAPGDVASTLKILAQYSGLKTSQPPGTFFTDEFLPATG